MTQGQALVVRARARSLTAGEEPNMQRILMGLSGIGVLLVTLIVVLFVNYVRYQLISLKTLLQ